MFEGIRLGKSEIFELVVKDQNGHKIEDWKCMKNDFPKVVKIIFSKYGFKSEQKVPEGNKDLDWAK